MAKRKPHKKRRNFSRSNRAPAFANDSTRQLVDLPDVDWALQDDCGQFSEGSTLGQLVASLSNPACVATGLFMEYSTIDDEGAKALAEALKVNTKLTVLENTFSEKLGNDGAVALAKALKVNTALTKLDLFSNKIGVEGVIAFAEALKVNTTLIHFNFAGNNIGFHGVKALSKALKVNTTLTEFHLDCNNFGSRGANALAGALKVNRTLTALFLDNCGIGDGGATAFAESLKVNTALKSLDLTFNNIDVHGVASLAEALKVNTTLTSLNLDHNHIDSDGAVALAETLRVNTTLTDLNLGYGDIGDEGTTALAEALNVNTTLNHLNLEGSNIRVKGMISFAEALKVNMTLKILKLNRSKNIGNEGATVLAGALKVNMGLTDFDLSYNTIGAEGATALAEALKVNTTLTCLHLGHNSIGVVGATALAEALKTNTKLTSFGHSFDKIDDETTAKTIDQFLARNCHLARLGPKLAQFASSRSRSEIVNVLETINDDLSILFDLIKHRSGWIPSGESQTRQNNSTSCATEARVDMKMTVTCWQKHDLPVFKDNGTTVDINMSSYIKKVIERSGQTITKAAATPCANSIFDGKDETDLLPKERREAFHSTVAMLRFVGTRGRPDILFAVGYLCGRVRAPTEQDEDKLKQLLEYLYGTKDMTITFGAEMQLDDSIKMLDYHKARRGEQLVQQVDEI